MGVKGRIKRRKKDITEAVAQSSGKPAPGLAGPGHHRREKRTPTTWGVLEPFRPHLGPVLDLLTPLINVHVGLVITTTLLFFSWFRSYITTITTTTTNPYRSRGVIGSGVYPDLITPERIAAYEALWSQEENNLWDWLDERVGPGPLSSSSSTYNSRDQHADGGRHRHPASNNGEKGHLSSPRSITDIDERMNQRQVAEALRLTQLRLDQLRLALERRSEPLPEEER